MFGSKTDKKLDVTALGELLVDFTPLGCSEAGMRIFEQNPGGAPANVLAALSKWGRKTGFLGKVGGDMHGAFLKETLKACGVGIEGLIEDEHVFTTLAFVKLGADGERQFSFARKPGADTCLRPEELWDDYLKLTTIFHFGSLSLTDEPARSATLLAVRKAKKSGAVISYDPNYRRLLWPGEEAAVCGMRLGLELADLVKLSEEESLLLTGEDNPSKAMAVLLRQGTKAAAITLGSKGAIVGNHEGMCLVPGIAAQAVDTTGAGDTFWAGVLDRLLAAGLGKTRPLAEISLDELALAARYGNAAASLCVEKHGGIPAMPEQAAVIRRMQ